MRSRNLCISFISLVMCVLLANSANAIEAKWVPCDGTHRHMSSWTESTERHYLSQCPSNVHLAYTCYKEIVKKTCNWCGSSDVISEKSHCFDPNDWN